MTIGCGQSGSINRGTLEANSVDDQADTDVKQVDTDLKQADTDFKQVDTDVDDVEPLAVGDRAPDFEVEVIGGELLRLSACVGATNNPTVLLFNRAHW